MPPPFFSLLTWKLRRSPTCAATNTIRVLYARFRGASAPRPSRIAGLQLEPAVSHSADRLEPEYFHLYKTLPVTDEALRPPVSALCMLQQQSFPFCPWRNE